jgi:glycosyltransferase involved in cell wall biosynthesis
MSRLVPEKGCHYLLKAWEDIPANRKKGMKLVIAGDTNFKDAYYYNLLEYEKMNDVIFTGFVSGNIKNELHSSAYCFIQPSTIEGLPISILEALSYGLFVIASDIEENTDTLKDCGVTFQNRNADDLRLKIEEAIHMSPDIFKKESIKAKDIVEKEYNWDHVVEKIEKELSGLLSCSL